MSLSALAVGGCFSTSVEVADDVNVNVGVAERPPNDAAFAALKEAHIRSKRRDGIDTDAMALLVSPVIHLEPGLPDTAECILIDGSQEVPYPLESVTRIDFAKKGITFYWYDGGAIPASPKPTFPVRDVNLITSDERAQIEAIISLIKTARQTPGRRVKR